MSTGLIDPFDEDAPETPETPHATPVRVPTAAPATASHWRGPLEVIAVVVVTVGLTVGATAWWLGGRGDAPTPTPGDFDPRFVAVGKAYLGDLGPAYASAWEDGAKILDSGQTIGMALDAVAKSWEANRKAAGNKRITPELSKVVAESKPDKDVTAEDRTALAKAYRGLAKGLGGR